MPPRMTFMQDPENGEEKILLASQRFPTATMSQADWIKSRHRMFNGTTILFETGAKYNIFHVHPQCKGGWWMNQ